MSVLKTVKVYEKSYSVSIHIKKYKMGPCTVTKIPTGTSTLSLHT